MALASYFIVCYLIVFSFLLGYGRAPFYVLVICLSGILTYNILIYAAIRTGFNRRFRDPSLTLLQISIAIFWNMVFLYYTESNKGSALLIYLIIFVFGLFKLNVRQFLSLSLFAVVGYGGVILLLDKNYPGLIDARSEVLNLVILAIVLPWFSVIGGYITRLKTRISDSYYKIKETELKFSTIFDSASEGIIVGNIGEGRFSDVNDKMCDMLGYTKEEILGLRVSDILPLNSDRSVTDRLDKLMKKEITVAGNIPVLKKDKTVFFADISASTVSLGENRYVVGMFRDITKRKQAEEIIQQSEAQYRLLADHMKDYVWLMDLNLRWKYISPSIEKRMGYTLNEFKRLPLNHFLTEKSFKLAMDTLSAEMPRNMASKEKIPYEVILELECRDREGSTFWIESTFSLIRDEQGSPVNLLGESRDITERKLMEEKLRYEEQRFRALVEHSSDIIVVVNREGTVTYINPAVEQVLGFKPEERIGTQELEFTHPDDVSFLVESFDTLVKNSNAPIMQGEMRLHHRNGNWRTLEAIGSNLVKNNVVEAIIVNYRDITERKLAEEELRKSEQRYQELSIIDDLTRLYNSRHFYNQLEKEIERSRRYEQPLTLVLLDLDNFKIFNDTYGHVEGDQVLSRLGQVIKKCLRGPDSAYRYGGEEFTVILPVTTSREGLITAGRIQTEFRKEIFTPVPGKEIVVTMSIGLSQYRLNENMREFVHRVDQLMYQAKNNGRDRIAPEF